MLRSNFKRSISLLLVLALACMPTSTIGFGGNAGGVGMPRGCSDSQIPVYSASTGKWSCGDPGAASMVYPGSGVPNSTGSAWGTSYTVGTTADDLVQLNGSAALPAVSGENLTDLNATEVTSGELSVDRLGDGTITLPKFANISSAVVIGRSTAGDGAPEALSMATLRTLAALVVGTNVQAYDADLTTFAGITPSDNVKTLLGAANYAAFKSSLSLNNVENTALSTWAGSSNITTLGTIATGVWGGTAIGGDKVNVHGTTAETSVASDDEILIYDTSEGVNRRMTQGNFVAGISASGVKLDIADNGVDESVGITEIATTGTDTNSIFTEPSDNKFLIDVGKAWPTASALAANGANCSAGQFPLGVDASGAVENCTALPTTLAGTANQVAVSAATGAITLSIPSNPTLPGTTTGTFSGNLTGNVTGNVTGTVSGNAGTVTTADAGGDTTTFPMLATSATGSLAPATDAGLSYNAGTNALTATTFVGNLTGNVTGAVTGNASTATTLTDGDKGDFTVSSGTATIDTGAITLAKMANMATASLLGRNTASTGVPEVLSAATARTLLGLGTVYQFNVGTGANNIPQLGSSPGTPDGTKFLRDDGTWVVPTGSGDVTSVGDCTSGACNDETSDGGSYIGLYSATAAARLRNNAGVLEARTAGDAGYANFRASTATFDAVNLNKASGTAGDLGLVEANSYDDESVGFSGPTENMIDNTSYRLKFTNTRPNNVNYVMAISSATPSGSGTPTSPYVYSTGWVDLDNYAALAGATFTGKVNTPVTGTAAGLNIGQSSGDPSSPVDGDIWILSSGLYAQIAGSKVGPFATGAPAFSEVTTGESTVALTVGTNGSLSATGTGTITATAAPVAGITGLGTGVATALAINVGSAGAPVVLNGAGGTPSAINLTNGTALPLAGVTDSTSEALGVGTLELGAASDTTIARASAGVATIEGVTLTRTIASGTQALGTAEIASGACATATDATTAGVATTDVINWGFNGDPTGVTGYAPSANGMLTIVAYPGSGHVYFKVCNNTAAAVTPGAITLNYNVVR